MKRYIVNTYTIIFAIFKEKSGLPNPDPADKELNPEKSLDPSEVEPIPDPHGTDPEWLDSDVGSMMDNCVYISGHVYDGKVED